MPRNKYPEETRNKIIDAAAKLFLTKGYARTTILDIVAGMDGLTRGAFYHHFKSKKEVFDAITARLSEVSSGWEADLAGKNGLNKLRAIMSMQKNFFVSPYKEMITLVWSLTKNPEFLVEQLHIGMLSAQGVAQVIAEGIADGSIAGDISPKLMAEFATVLLNFWISPVYFPDTDDELKEKLLFIKWIFDGLGCDVFDEETFNGFLVTAKELRRAVKNALEHFEQIEQ